ncbi:MAG: NAD-dependent epimerase/dehydratase family protein [Ilumatobacteraceae bacterium]
MPSSVVTPMKVMVCGGAGFIGSHLVERLLADGHFVDIVDDLSTGSLSNLSVARSMNAGVKFHHLDVMSPEFVNLVGLRQSEVIYHMALLPPSATATNMALHSAALMLAVLEAARVHTARKVIVAIPAGLLYGEVPMSSLPVKEGRASTAIGVPHVMANAILELLGVYRESHDLEFTALAVANVFGPRQRAEDGVVAAFASAVVNQKRPVLFGNGKQTRDFIFIDDVIDALARAHNKGGGLVINIGTGIQTSILDLWNLMAVESTMQLRKEQARSGDLRRLAVSPVRARIQLGWSSWTSLTNGIDELLNSRT